MLNIVIGVLLVSLASFSGWMLIEQMSLTLSVADQRENIRRLDMAADAVAAKLGSPAGANPGAIYAPAPMAGSGAYPYTQLPDWIPGVHSTVAGVPFRYCAYAPDKGAVRISDAPNSYLLIGDVVENVKLLPFQPAGIVISAGLNGSVPPACNDVDVVEGRVVVPGGLARIVSGVKSVSDAQLTDGSSFEVWAAPGAAGRGTSPADPISLTAAMNVWKLKLPKSMVIHLPAGAVFADEGGTLSGAFSMGSERAGTVRSSKLTIASAGGSVIWADTAFDPQGSLALSGVSMPQTVVVLGSFNSASFQGSQVKGVRVASGSSAAFNGNATVQGDGLVVAGTATVEGGLVVSGTSSGSLIDVQSSGRLMLSGATLSLANGSRGIELHGDLSGGGTISVSSVGAAVALQDGSRMAFEGTIGSGAGSSTLLAEGAPAFISGRGTIGAGANGCWNPTVEVGGSTFPTIFGASSASSSAPTGLVQPAPPAADPETGTVKAPAMEAYVQQTNTYTRAVAASAGNKSRWLCGV
ncbi:hypothetical protein [Sphingomonas sp. 3-13AW]|uniref:hypothetical protein n=1 Tax=Sphingomonas sp. 3-13AW TaxID=3050450 RepID=UPI003BB7A0F4